MAFIINTAKTIRNNWKKTVFFTGLTAFGIHYGKDRYEESCMRVEFCKEAKKYGDQLVRTGQRIRKVTVFLNPAASKGKASKYFEKNVAPILHMAGLEVTVVKTEYEGQAKRYMDVVENTDAVIAAGGDGTLLEVITGLLRRKDQSTKMVPIGVLPLGFTNTLAGSLVENNKNIVRWQMELALSIVKEVTKPIDVMNVTAEGDKNVFAVNGLQWGAYRDAEQRKSKYWYFGGLKHRWTYLMSSLKQWPPLREAHISFVRPCEGCSKCYVAPPEPVWKWWHIFLPPRREVPKKNYKEIDNPDCGVDHNMDVKTLELQVQTCNHRKDVEEKSLTICSEPDDVSKSDFIKEGWKRIHGEPTEENVSKVEVSQFSLAPVVEEGNTSWYYIDNEQFEVMPIDVKLLKDKLQVYYCPQPAQISIDVPWTPKFA